MFVYKYISIFFCLGKLVSTDIDSRLCDKLRSFSSDPKHVDSLFDEFDKSDLTGVVNKSAYICNLIKQWKIQHPEEQKSSDNNSQKASSVAGSDRSNEKFKPGPDETKLKVDER